MNPLEPKDPDFAERCRASFGRQGLMRMLGARIERLEPGECVLGLSYRPDLSQQHGYFHAGIVSTLGDTAGGYAAFSLMPANSSVLTVEFKINMIAPAVGETLIARGRVVRSGRTLTVAAVDVFCVAGGVETQCAVMQQTLICLRDRPDGPADDANGARV